MVEVIAALRAIQDTTFIVLEHIFVSLDGNREGAFSSGGLHAINVLSLNVNMTRRSDSLSTLVFVLFAASGSASVGVGRFVNGVVFPVVIESFVFKAATAAMALGVAVDKLLFGELRKVTRGDFVATFHGLNSRESPA